MQTTKQEIGIYSDVEANDAIRELFSYPAFVEGMKAFLPEELSRHILEVLDQTHNTADFQRNIIHPFLKTIERISITGLSASGLEQLSPDESYLFISNHRDIGLDSAYLNMLLFEHGITTSQIAIGDNLMQHRIAELLFRINKSFVVRRSGNPRDLYEYSLKLSAYIREQVSGNLDSVWIAQREGRAKDGNDRTQTGVLKMLGLSSRAGEDLKSLFQSLKIVPVAISYEYNPCDMLMTREYLHKLADSSYKKSFEEDLKHILLGLKGEKGRVHFHFGKPLREELDILDSAPSSKQQLELMAGLIDRVIHEHYRLHPIHYIALDLLGGQQMHEAHYSPEEWQQHQHRFEKQLAAIPEDQRKDGRDYLLGMYANPVINAKSYGLSDT